MKNSLIVSSLLSIFIHYLQRMNEQFLQGFSPNYRTENGWLFMMIINHTNTIICLCGRSSLYCWNPEGDIYIYLYHYNLISQIFHLENRLSIRLFISGKENDAIISKASRIRVMFSYPRPFHCSDSLILAFCPRFLPRVFWVK